jgi:hypothetical protein
MILDDEPTKERKEGKEREPEKNRNASAIMQYNVSAKKCRRKD